MYSLALECAHSVYGSTPPTEKYAVCTAKLLIGTAATESFFKHRRQIGYDFNSDNGGWGLWQTERKSIEDNIRLLKNREDVRRNASNFLLGHTNIDGILQLGPSEILRLVYSWDRLAILMCRLHYFKFRAPIPYDFQAQAEYYKIYYNTLSGKGSVEKYMKDWYTYVKGTPYVK